MKSSMFNIYTMSDGKATVVSVDSIVSGGFYVGNGSAVRERGDVPNSEIGDLLATARALRQMASRMERRANGLVSHAEEIKRHAREIERRKEVNDARQVLRKLTEQGIIESQMSAGEPAPTPLAASETAGEPAEEVREMTKLEKSVIEKNDGAQRWGW